MVLFFFIATPCVTHADWFRRKRFESCIVPTPRSISSSASSLGSSDSREPTIHEMSSELRAVRCNAISEALRSGAHKPPELFKVGNELEYQRCGQHLTKI